jgi:hypothetical protein
MIRSPKGRIALAEVVTGALVAGLRAAVGSADFWASAAFSQGGFCIASLDGVLRSYQP